jgi:hypothetical protein
MQVLDAHLEHRPDAGEAVGEGGDRKTRLPPSKKPHRPAVPARWLTARRARRMVLSTVMAY